MTSSTDLGEILGSLLTAANVAPRPDPVEELARDLSASWLAGEIAGSLLIEATEAYGALRLVPDNMLNLLHSPEGWASLANYVAGTLCRGQLDYCPTIH